MLVRPSRLAAGTLVLVLPLAAVAGCGAAKKRTIKQELSSASQHLQDSHAASFTLHLDDSKGSLTKLATSDGDLEEAAAKDLIGSSITVTLDAKSASDIKGIDAKATDAQIKDALKDAHFALQVKTAKDVVAEIRLVDSTLFARVNVAEIDRVAKEGGEDGVADGLDEFISSAPPQYQPVLKDAKAGKWLKLPLSDYIDKLKSVTEALPTPDASGPALDQKKLKSDLITSLKPYVKVTDANNSSSDRVLDVKVDVRGSLKALLNLAKSTKGFPFADALGEADPAEIDKNVKAGTATGTIKLSDGHLKQVAVDLPSVLALDATSTDTPDVSGSRLVVDIDDSADAIAAPTDNVSSVDVKALIDDLVQSFTDRLSTGFGGLTGDVSS